VEKKDVERKAVDPTASDQQTYHLELQEERLRIEREPRPAGTVRITVRIGKRVIERVETVSVPVREEIIVIECVAGSGTVMVGDVELREGETFELTVLKEEVNVSKDVVVYEDVTIRKEQVMHTERVQQTLRREDLVVDHSGDLTITGEPAAPAPEPVAVPAPDVPMDSAPTMRIDQDGSSAEAVQEHGQEIEETRGLPLSPELEAAGTVIVGERPFAYTYGLMGDDGEGPLAEGVPVVTSDGEPLGTVGEIAEDRFRVRVLLGGDVWLPRSAISGVAPGGDITLTGTRDELEVLEVTGNG
jgi:uncharacterized protein (TIGR02271 family)